MISPMFQKHLIAREVAAVDLKCMHQTKIKTTGTKKIKSTNSSVNANILHPIFGGKAHQV